MLLLGGFSAAVIDRRRRAWWDFASRTICIADPNATAVRVAALVAIGVLIGIPVTRDILYGDVRDDTNAESLEEERLADELLEAGDVEGAIDHFDRVIEISPKYAGARAKLGEAHLILGRLEAGSEHCSRSHEIDPEEPLASQCMVWAAVLRADWETAASFARGQHDPISERVADALAAGGVRERVDRHAYSFAAPGGWRSAPERIPEMTRALNDGLPAENPLGVDVVLVPGEERGAVLAVAASRSPIRFEPEALTEGAIFQNGAVQKVVRSVSADHERKVLVAEFGLQANETRSTLRQAWHHGGHRVVVVSGYWRADDSQSRKAFDRLSRSLLIDPGHWY